MYSLAAQDTKNARRRRVRRKGERKGKRKVEERARVGSYM
jgi:hypothetical protein